MHCVKFLFNIQCSMFMIIMVCMALSESRTRQELMSITSFGRTQEFKRTLRGTYVDRLDLYSRPITDRQVVIFLTVVGLCSPQ